jgi:hypothetical protein
MKVKAFEGFPEAQLNRIYFAGTSRRFEDTLGAALHRVTRTNNGH